MATKAQRDKVSPERARQLKRDAERIDREEAERIKGAGRAALQRHDDIEQLVRLLREERLRQGLSLADVDERSGIGRANISRLENSPDANPTLGTLQRYAEALGRRILVMLAEEGDGR